MMVSSGMKFSIKSTNSWTEFLQRLSTVSYIIKFTRVRNFFSFPYS